MAKSFRDARDSAEARLEETVAPVAEALGQKKAGIKDTPKERARRRMEQEPERAADVKRRLQGLSDEELRRVAKAVSDLLDETR